MSRPLFMSPEHVALMNRLLHGASEVNRLCAELSRGYVVAYVLSDGPQGATVHWHMKVDPAAGVTLALGAPTTPADLTINSDYRAMIASARAAREGSSAANPVAIEGDAAVAGQVAPILAAARQAATVDVEFPLDVLNRVSTPALGLMDR